MFMHSSHHLKQNTRAFILPQFMLQPGLVQHVIEQPRQYGELRRRRRKVARHNGRGSPKKMNDSITFVTTTTLVAVEPEGLDSVKLTQINMHLLNVGLSDLP